MSYIGVLEQLRNPEILWEAVHELRKENSDFAKDFKITFAGRVDEKILNQLNELQLSNSIINLGYLSHQESVQIMQDASLLLITNFPESASKGIIPGKLFEYLATGNPILSFGPKDADVAQILIETEAGNHFSYAQKKEAKTYLLHHYNQWKSKSEISKNSSIDQYSRQNLTKKLVAVLGQ